MLSNRTRLIAILLFIALTAGCATKKPLEIDASFKSPFFSRLEIDSITVLPILDSRLDKSLDTDLQGAINPVLGAALKQRGYSFELLVDPTLLINITPKAIESSTRSWVKSLGPANSRWLMLVVVTRLSREYGLGATGSAEVSGYLYDKTTEELIWKAGGQGEFSAGYLLAAIVDDTALQIAADRMMLAMPIKRLNK